MYVLISDKLNTHRIFAFLQFFLCTTLSFLVLCPANSTHLGLSGLSVLSLILRKTSRSHLIYFLCANIWYLSSGNLSNYSIQLVCSPSLRDCVSLFPIFSVLRTIVSHFYCFFFFLTLLQFYRLNVTAKFICWSPNTQYGYIWICDL